MAANPSGAWDSVPVYGFYFKGDDVTPETGRVTFSFTDRVTRTDGKRIYPAGTTVSCGVGDVPTGAAAAARDAVRASWRAADQAAAGGSFDGAAWDARWNVLLSGAVFASVPASDDPDIVQTGYQIKVTETLNSSSGKTFYIQPVLANLSTTPPGVNLGLVDVPPGSPTNPAPIYAKGLPGGVASLDSTGRVPASQLPAGSGTGSGTQGATGPKGDTGATGPQGPQGIQGLTGATGPAGSIVDNGNGTSTLTIG
jgi:hypothetical protein